MRPLTSSVVASSTAASPSVLEASTVAPGGASVVIALETAATPTAPEATTASVVKALFGRWASLAAFLVVLPHQLVCFFSLQLDEQHLIQEVANIWQREVGWEGGRTPEETRRSQDLLRSGPLHLQGTGLPEGRGDWSSERRR